MSRFPARLVPLTLLIGLAVVPSATAAPAPVPCSNSGGGKYTCQWYPPGDGIRGGAKVIAGGRLVGYLHQGSNWVICQQVGATVRNSSGDLNNWYGWTQADNGRWGWASPLEARGGANFGAFSGVPNCNGAHGPAPSQGGVWGASAPALPAPTSPQSVKRRQACSKLNEDQRLSVGGHLREITYTEYYSGGGRPSRSYERESRSFGMGKVDIRLTTCKMASGKWRVLDPVNVTPDYNGVDAAGQIEGGGSRGWGLAPRELTSSKLSLAAMECDDQGLLTTGKFLLGVPLPIPFLADVGRFVVSANIPDGEVRCESLTPLTLRLDIAKRNGKVALRGDSGRWIRTQDWGQREPNLKAVWDATITARPK